jgi:hypothetical protein
MSQEFNFRKCTICGESVNFDYFTEQDGTVKHVDCARRADDEKSRAIQTHNARYFVTANNHDGAWDGHVWYGVPGVEECQHVYTTGGHESGDEAYEAAETYALLCSQSAPVTNLLRAGARLPHWCIQCVRTLNHADGYYTLNEYYDDGTPVTVAWYCKECGDNLPICDGWEYVAPDRTQAGVVYDTRWQEGDGPESDPRY